MTMPIRIEKNVPMPVSARDGRNMYPWSDMLPGDSFFVETGKPENFIRNVYPKNRDGKRFVAKKMAGGVRVWRVV